MNDRQLLDRYLATHSPEDFAALVRQHANLVYSAARRQLADTQLAEDVTQAVFLLLQQKAHRIKGPLAGWLVQAAYFTCRDLRKLTARRQYHERRAALMQPKHLTPSDTPVPEWESYAPALDAALMKLSAIDRAAITLRFLQGLPLRDVGESLNLTEDSARKRVERALNKLRLYLVSQAPYPTSIPQSSFLATALLAHGLQSAPAHLLTALISGTATATSGAIKFSLLTKGVSQAMLYAKLKFVALMVLVATIIVTSTTVLILHAASPTPATTTATPVVATDQSASEPIGTEIHVDIADDVRKLIPLILANEALYYDAEIKYHVEYTSTADPTAPQPDELFTLSSSVEGHQIRQGELYWLKYDHESMSYGGTKGDESELDGYDGQVTRKWCQNSIGNLHLDRSETPLLIHPHKLISFSEDCTIGQYLQTGFARKKLNYPGTRIDEKIVRIADATFMNKTCIVLERHMTFSGFDKYSKNDAASTHNMDRIWLCPETNYLPLKIEHTDLRQEVVTDWSQVDALHEITPGVFFPKQVTRNVNTNKNKSGALFPLSNKRTWSFKSVSLQPKYPKERFAEVSFKPGALVYVLRNNIICTSLVAGPGLDQESIDAMVASDLGMNPSSQNDASPVTMPSTTPK